MSCFPLVFSDHVTCPLLELPDSAGRRISGGIPPISARQGASALKGHFEMLRTFKVYRPGPFKGSPDFEGGKSRKKSVVERVSAPKIVSGNGTPFVQSIGLQPRFSHFRARSSASRSSQRFVMRFASHLTRSKIR